MRVVLALGGVALLVALPFVACDPGTSTDPPGSGGNSVSDAGLGAGGTHGGASDAGIDGGAAGGVRVDAGSDAAIDHSAELPPGITPPVLWFWRGIHQDNLSWYTDGSGRSCAAGDTTMWFQCPGNSGPNCGGAPACDPDHFGTPDVPCTGVDCCWRNWDDPRGPEFKVISSTGPVEIHNQGAQGLNGSVPEYGFGVTLCAAPGTVAVIDTCPRSDVYSCVQDRYPQFVDDCTTVLLTVAVPPAQYDPSLAGCYSTKADVTITF